MAVEPVGIPRRLRECYAERHADLVFLDPGAMLPRNVRNHGLRPLVRLRSNVECLVAPPGIQFLVGFPNDPTFLDVNAQTTPEPASWALLLGGGILMGALRKARKRRKGRQSRSNPAQGLRPLPSTCYK